MMHHKQAFEAGHICMRGSRWGQGVRTPPPLKYRKNIILAILVPNPWKITKLPSQHLMFGIHRPASETLFKCRFAGGPIVAHFWILYSPSSEKNNNQKRLLIKCQYLSGPPPPDKTFWIRAWLSCEMVHTIYIHYYSITAFLQVTDDFVQRVKGTDITIISQEIFEHDPLTRVENLKVHEHDLRICLLVCCCFSIQ